MASIEEKVEDLVKEKIELMGYELYDVEYSKEGKNYFLRIFIDKPEGISISDCEKVNNEIMPELDKADYIKQQYFLEVSSTRNRKEFTKRKAFRTKYWRISKYKIIQKRSKWEKRISRNFKTI